MLYWRGERDEGSGQHRRSHARHRCHGPDAGRRRSHPPNCYVAGVYNCGSTIIREEGARSLWKGLTPFAGNLTLKYFLRFGTNAFYQNLLRDAVRFRLTPLAALCNGRSEGCKMLTLTMLIWHTCMKAICMPTVGPVRRAAALRLIHGAFQADFAAEHVNSATQDGKLSDVRRMAAGFSAGVTEALIIVTPFEVGAETRFTPTQLVIPVDVGFPQCRRAPSRSRLRALLYPRCLQVVKIRLQQQHGMDSAKLLYKVSTPLCWPDHMIACLPVHRADGRSSSSTFVASALDDRAAVVTTWRSDISARERRLLSLADMSTAGV